MSHDPWGDASDDPIPYALAAPFTPQDVIDLRTELDRAETDRDYLARENDVLRAVLTRIADLVEDGLVQ